MKLMKKLAPLVPAIVAVLGFSSAVFASVPCPPNLDLQGGILKDDVAVENFCVIANGKVDGDIRVTSGFLIITNVDVTGDLRVYPESQVSAQSVSVYGDIRADSADLVILDNTFNYEETIGGDVKVRNSGFTLVSGTTVGGDVTILGNSFAIIESNMIDGDLKCIGVVNENGNTVGGEKVGSCAD